MSGAAAPLVAWLATDLVAQLIVRSHAAGAVSLVWSVPQGRLQEWLAPHRIWPARSASVI